MHARTHARIYMYTYILLHIRVKRKNLFLIGSKALSSKASFHAKRTF